MKRDYYEETLNWFRKNRVLGPIVACIVIALAAIGLVTPVLEMVFILLDRLRPLELISVDITNTDPIVLDFKVQNLSSSVKVLHKLVLQILEVPPSLDQDCLTKLLTKGPLLSSARYRIEIPPGKWREGKEVSINISHEIGPDEADRFEVQLVSPETTTSGRLPLPEDPNPRGNIKPLPTPMVPSGLTRTTIRAVIVYGRNSRIISDPIDITLSCP